MVDINNMKSNNFVNYDNLLELGRAHVYTDILGLSLLCSDHNSQGC